MIRAIVLGALLVGCISSQSGSDPDPEAGPTDAGPVDGNTSGPGRRTQGYRTPAAPRADFLFVVDDSGSMCQEQARLVRNFEALAEHLLEARPPVDFRIAFVTTDMRSEARRGRFVDRAAAPTPALNCADGDGQPWIPDTDGCATLADAGELPAVLSNARFETAEALGDRFRCLAQPGTDGDGFEQGLEAMRVALSCDGPNAAAFAACCVDGVFDPSCEEETEFLRPGAALVVIVLSDEDDCSDRPDAPISRTSNDNCVWDRDTLTPVAEYADFLRSLRPSRVRFRPIVGLRAYTDGGAEIVYERGEPAEPRCDEASPDYDPEVELDVCCPGGRCPGPARPSCESSDGAAFAGSRYLELAELLEPDAPPCPHGQDDGADCGSICVGDYTRALPGFDWAGYLTAYCLDTNPVEGSVRIALDGRELGPGEYELVPDEGCAGGVYVQLSETPPPESRIVIEYDAAE